MGILGLYTAHIRSKYKSSPFVFPFAICPPPLETLSRRDYRTPATPTGMDEAISTGPDEALQRNAFHTDLRPEPDAEPGAHRSSVKRAKKRGHQANSRISVACLRCQRRKIRVRTSCREIGPSSLHKRELPECCSRLFPRADVCCTWLSLPTV